MKRRVLFRGIADHRLSRKVELMLKHQLHKTQAASWSAPGGSFR
jgi:hypothetical protein